MHVVATVEGGVDVAAVETEHCSEARCERPVCVIVVYGGSGTGAVKRRRGGRVWRHRR